MATRIRLLVVMVNCMVAIATDSYNSLGTGSSGRRDKTQQYAPQHANPTTEAEKEAFDRFGTYSSLLMIYYFEVEGG